MIKKGEKKKRIKTGHKQLHIFQFLKKHKDYNFAMMILPFFIHKNTNFDKKIYNTDVQKG
ncbi:hypothetical protein BpHYR1_051748 [Brachionus plicatilis]|uniref:Uncharacterized protein n=1 Tax=Brachionus plicatilis TaxID=10195 RepID=A0A3M7QAM7_BRAPC|nr:hypothetical protein BpHYR1_051748 [Brachionus plicatilis]